MNVHFRFEMIHPEIRDIERSDITLLTIQNPAWRTLFSVPTAVVDQYLKIATPSQLKVLLYLLRHCPDEIHCDVIGKQTGCLPELVEEAILFWQQTDLLSEVSTNPPAEQPSTQPASTPAPDIASNPQEPKPVAALPRTSAEVQLLPAEIAEMIQTSESLQTLFRMVEQQFGKPLNHMEQRSLIWLHDYLGFPSDVILTVITYCQSIQKGSIPYAERILIDWWNQGITTLQQAQDTIKEMEQRHSYQHRIMKLLEMHRNPTQKQQAYMEEWRQKAIPLDLIRYAYEKTVEQTDKLSFPYMQRILDDWTKAGYQTRTDVDANDKPPEPIRTRKQKKKEIPISEKSEAYKSLIYNMDE